LRVSKLEQATADMGSWGPSNGAGGAAEHATTATASAQAGDGEDGREDDGVARVDAAHWRSAMTARDVENAQLRTKLVESTTDVQRLAAERERLMQISSQLKTELRKARDVPNHGGPSAPPNISRDSVEKAVRVAQQQTAERYARGLPARWTAALDLFPLANAHSHPAAARAGTRGKLGRSRRPCANLRRITSL